MSKLRRRPDPKATYAAWMTRVARWAMCTVWLPSNFAAWLGLRPPLVTRWMTKPLNPLGTPSWVRRDPSPPASFASNAAPRTTTPTTAPSSPPAIVPHATTPNRSAGTTVCAADRTGTGAPPHPASPPGSATPHSADEEAAAAEESPAGQAQAGGMSGAEPAVEEPTVGRPSADVPANDAGHAPAETTAAETTADGHVAEEAAPASSVRASDAPKDDAIERSDTALGEETIPNIPAPATGKAGRGERAAAVTESPSWTPRPWGQIWGGSDSPRNVRENNSVPPQAGPSFSAARPAGPPPRRQTPPYSPPAEYPGPRARRRGRKRIAALVTAIMLARAGLRDAKKPIGCYLFSGPTGVGKTEVARQLSNTLGIPLTRFDMSEYMERHSISRLIGAPPGYVGFDQGGLLTDAIDQHPHCVLLLDEIEKAHPDLFNVLLQVMDHGKLTDHNGKTVDFRNVILIMTTNAGAADMAKSAIGFGRKTRVGEDEEAIKRMFTPEFRNRLDAVIPFAGLTPEIVAQVVEKFVMQLEAQLADRNVTIELSSAAKEFLAERGYDPLYGARPLARVIQELIKKPLAEELLFGKLVNGGAIRVSVRDGELAFDITEAPKPALPRPDGGSDNGEDESAHSQEVE